MKNERVTLADKIISAESLGYKFHGIENVLVDRVMISTRVYCQNVCNYANSFKELLVEDLPDVRHPFEKFSFFEFKIKGVDVGVLVREWDKESLTRSYKQLKDFSSYVPDDCYLIELCCFGLGDDRIVRAFGIGLFIVDYHGKRIGKGIHTLSDANKDLDGWLATSCMVTLMAIGFCNCKNVKLVNNNPSHKFSKCFQKRSGKPLISYHNIEIEPMKRIIASEGNLSHNGIKKALHICRGHFNHYTSEAPRFGRSKDGVGMFWINSHTRGSIQEGIVHKKYNVNQPK